MVCGFNFKDEYGELGDEFIEVHHCTPLSIQNDNEIINPNTDLAVLCANCHRMIHRKISTVMTINELIEIKKKTRAELEKEDKVRLTVNNPSAKVR